MRDAEDRVLTRARGEAEACGVSEAVMESIYRAILRASVERQHRVGIAERARRGARVLVVGSAGGMGTWFGGFLSLVGHRVDGVDPAWASQEPQSGRVADLSRVASLEPYEFILVSVPLDRTPDTLLQVLEREPRGVVVEIASIKSHLQPALRWGESRGVRTLSLHPMFGPGRSPYEPLTFVLAARGDPEAEKNLLAPLLQHPFTRIVSIPFDHHDLLMGWLLGLAHLNGMLFGAALASSGLDAEELRACASTTFTRQAATAHSVLSEDPRLYFDIQRLNPHREGVYRAARNALDRLIDLVEAGDLEGFRGLLAGARRVVRGEA